MPTNPAPAGAPETPALPFRPIADLIREHAATHGHHAALIDGDDSDKDGDGGAVGDKPAASIDYAALDRLMDRVAASLQRDGLAPGDVIAVCAASSARYAALFLGALRAGVVVAPLAASVTAGSFRSMLDDASARLLFIDQTALPARDGAALSMPVVNLDHHLDKDASTPTFDAWLEPPEARPQPVAIDPAMPFNIIYSSGTTGTPKGIVQSHGMRWSHVARAGNFGYSRDTVTLLATPLYSNTTLVVFFPTIAFGGTVVVMAKFDAARYLALAERMQATNTMLVPVQYRRLMAHPRFDDHDLSAFHSKFSTSAPFGAALKAEVLARWPGGLIEFYGMTEGGGTCILAAHEHPTKLHTVGQPAEGHDIRLIDEAGRELPADAVEVAGEVVGHSAGMMTGYHGQPGKTAEAEWFDATGKRFIRTGDVGRFDAEGFLTLVDRRKDLIISGGFNIYPSDLEAVLCAHADVAEAAVVAVPSAEWGETPAAFVVRREGSAVDEEALRLWANAQLGKTQRIAVLAFTDELPRSAIGKVLKRELRDRFVAAKTP